MNFDAELRDTTRFARVVHVSRCDSTQVLSTTDAGSDSAIFWADHQTAGRGRQGRSWHDGAQDIAATFRLTDLALASPTQLAAAVPVAISRALDPYVPGITIKWPNDLLLGGRKLSGILIDTHGQPPTTYHVGIGINVNRTSFPEDLRECSTSIALATGREADREALLLTLAQSISAVVNDLHAGTDPTSLADEFGRRLGLLGRRVRATTGEQKVEGTLTHIDLENAFLDGDMVISLAHLKALNSG